MSFPNLSNLAGPTVTRCYADAVGAIGISGGHDSEDMEVARAALSAVDADIT